VGEKRVDGGEEEGRMNFVVDALGRDRELARALLLGRREHVLRLAPAQSPHCNLAPPRVRARRLLLEERPVRLQQREHLAAPVAQDDPPRSTCRCRQTHYTSSRAQLEHSPPSHQFLCVRRQVMAQHQPARPQQCPCGHIHVACFCCFCK
jgi:hypothetical protein